MILSCARLRNLLLAGLLIAAPAWADPVLPHVLGDHMVLQRNRPIRLWGWAAPGEKIKVTIDQASASAVADPQRHWSVTLPAMDAGGPYTVTIAGHKTVVLKDVLIGEVWIASGQSNMTYALNDAAGGPEEVRRADYPQVRLFKVPHKIATSTQQDVLPADWHICTPDTVKDFSAVAYFFARDLHRKLGVPVGVIESAWQGSPIEDWLAPPAYRNDPELAEILEKWKAESQPVRAYADTPKSFQLQFKDFELVREDGPSEPVVSAAYFHSEDVHALHWNYDWTDAPGTQFELLGSGATSIAQISGHLDNSQQSLANAFWNSDRAPLDLSQYKGLRFKVRGDGSFRVRFLQPTIDDWDDYASTYQSISEEWHTVTIQFRDLRQEGWGVEHDFTPASQIGLSIESVTRLGYPNRPPSGMYHAMIEPLLPFSIRGAIWYQGESNALRAAIYRKELPALITGWRAGWKNSDLPFLVVQLPNHGAVPEQPGESAWAELRDAQLHTLQTVPNVGLAVTIDVGDPKNVHPSRKAEVGERLALWALATTYHEPLAYSGPLIESYELKGMAIAVKFTHTDGGLATSDGRTVAGFAIAGADRKYHWAHAEIEGDTVVVSSEEVSRPISVRYAWGDSPVCNLANKEGLPASPFQTN